MRLYLPSSSSLSLAILTSTICQSIAGSPLHEVLFNDFLSMGSSDQCAGSPDTTNVSFDFTPSPDSEWSDVNKDKESQTFFAEMKHEDTDNPSQSWAVRFGPGGNIYSLKGAEYGESIPPQTKGRAAWMDEVTQSVAVDIWRNKATHPWYIHQAGTYQYDDAYLNQSFYSPSLASHCEGDTCTFASWGQQAWVPTVYKSPAMYIHRYRNCGGGRIEYTQGFVNFADPADGPNLLYLNMPWAGVRTSKLPDLYWSNSDGTMDTKIPRADIPGWGNDTGNMPELRKSGGFTTFGEDRSENEAMALSYVHGKDPTYGQPDSWWYRAPSRARCGMSGRDFTVFTVNGRINFPPQHIYTNRSFLISGKLKDMETKAAELVPDAYVDMTKFNELGSNGRKLEIYNEGQDYGVAFAPEEGGTTTSCGRGTSVCEGSTVPKNGLKPHYAITCGDSVYFGPDLYHFSPPREDTGDYLTSEPIRSYACVNEGIGVFPKFTLLGFFPDNGECTSLQSSNYDESFCPVETAQPTSNPTSSPTASPTANPTSSPTAIPTASPTSSPTANPTTSPTNSPTANPTMSPTNSPTENPTTSPTNSPTAIPTTSPTNSPTSIPTATPTKSPTSSPTARPTNSLTSSPTAFPTNLPTPGLDSCNDNPLDNFYYHIQKKLRTCGWLKDKKRNIRKRACKQKVTKNNELPAIKVCFITCEPWMAFMYKRSQRSCSWLAGRSFTERQQICDGNNRAAQKCPYTCKVCPKN